MCQVGHQGFPDCDGMSTKKDCGCVFQINGNGYFSESSAMRIAACGCSIIGSSSLACDFSGKCPCKVGYTGEKCDQCQSGYSKDRSGACIGIYL